jgi:hypothetical protein
MFRVPGPGHGREHAVAELGQWTEFYVVIRLNLPIRGSADAV